MTAQGDKVDRADRLTDAFLTILAEKGWERLTLVPVVETAGLERRDLYGLAVHRLDLPMLYSERLTRHMLDDFDAGDDDSVRDRLFDLLMNRFDAMADDKAAVTALSRGARRDPLLALTLVPTIATAMEHALAAALDRPLTPRDALRVPVLCAVYGAGLRAFIDDDSADMAKTMSALDKRLAQVERAATRIC